MYEQHNTTRRTASNEVQNIASEYFPDELCTVPHSRVLQPHQHALNFKEMIRIHRFMCHYLKKSYELQKKELVLNFICSPQTIG